MRSRALSLAALAFLVGLGGWTAEPQIAAAQQLDAGKPPAQIFSGTCSACHRSPRGLVRSVSPGSLQGFLRQHYTTGSEMAGTMAAYVLGNGGTDRVAEPSPKREPKQQPKADRPDVAARTAEPKEQPKAARQTKAGKKGQPEPAPKDSPSESEPEKAEAPKPETPEPPKTEAAAVECKVDEPAKQTTASTDGEKANPTPPRQPATLLTLPGFPAPQPEPEPEPTPVATAATSPDCDPKAASSTAQADESAKEQKEQTAQATPAVADASNAEQQSATESAAPSLDIMQEEVHSARPARTGQQKKRAATP